MSLVRIISIIGISIAFPSLASAAKITKVDRTDCHILLEGPIEKGDLERLTHIASADGMLRDAFIDEPQHFLCLNSPGGSYLEGLAISEFMIKYAIGTRIEKGSLCASACAIIFMSGTSRGEEWDQPKRLLHVGGSLGFHAPYLSLKDTEGYSSKDVETFFDLANRLMSGFAKIFAHQSPFYSDSWIRGSLISEIYAKGREELLFVDMVDKAGRWDIELYGFKPKKLTLAHVAQACYNFQEWVQDRPGQKYKPDAYSNPIIQDKKTGYYKVDTGGMEESYCDVGVWDEHIRICSVNDFTASNHGRCPNKYWIINLYKAEAPETKILSLE